LLGYDAYWLRQAFYVSTFLRPYTQQPNNHG